MKYTFEDIEAHLKRAKTLPAKIKWTKSLHVWYRRQSLQQSFHGQPRAFAIEIANVQLQLAALESGLPEYQAEQKAKRLAMRKSICRKNIFRMKRRLKLDATLLKKWTRRLKALDKKEPSHVE